METAEITIPVLIKMPFDAHAQLRLEAILSKNGDDKKTLGEVIRDRIIRDLESHPVRLQKAFRV